MLTDLVIGCCPIGLNNTPTMKTRFERQGIAPVAKEALMTLRQGLGRLIRNSQVRDRHVWMLDGRIWSNWPHMQQFTMPAQYVINSYPKKAAIKASAATP